MPIIPDQIRIRQVSDKLHIKYLLGVPDDWTGAEGKTLVISTDNQMVFANVTNVSDGKVQIDGITPSGYLSEVIDPDTLEIVVVGGFNKLGVKQNYLCLATGGTVLDNIGMADGKLVDGVDISEIPSNYARLTNPDPQIFVGSVIFSQDVWVLGTLHANNIAPVSGFWYQEVIAEEASGSDTDYYLTKTPVDVNSVMIFCNGIYQNRTIYTISGKHITFNSPPLEGWNISTIYLTSL